MGGDTERSPSATSTSVEFRADVEVRPALDGVRKSVAVGFRDNCSLALPSSVLLRLLVEVSV